MSNTSKHNDQKGAQLITWAFLLMLLLPGMVLLLQLVSGQLEPPKQHSVTSYGKFYLENYGLKSTFSKGYLNFKNALQENPIPHRVIKGKDDWYFLGNHYDQIFDDAFGNANLSEQEMHQMLKAIERVQKKLQERGIAFYLMIPPNKNQIYKDKLPFQLKQHPTNLEQFIEYVESHSSLSIIAFKNVLLNARQATEAPELYFKYDTHWNQYGAYYSYRHFMEAVNKNDKIPIVALDRYDEDYVYKNYDITRMLHLEVTEDALVLEPKAAYQDLITPSDYPNTFRHYTNTEGQKRVVFHGDSFMYAILPFINSSFEETFYIKNNYQLNEELLDEVQPDLVIFEMVERNLKELKTIR